MSDFLMVNDPADFYSEDIIYKRESYEIIGCCYEVHKTLGRGFLESVYTEALSFELRKKGIAYELEKPFKIPYKNIILRKTYICDFIVENKIILEIKAQRKLHQDHTSQLLNYLAVTKCQLGMLINFGEDRLEYKRFVR